MAETERINLEGFYYPGQEFYLYEISDRYNRFYWFEGVQVIDREHDIWRYDKWWDGTGKPDESKASAFLAFIKRHPDEYTATRRLQRTEFFGDNRHIHLKPVEKESDDVVGN